MFCGAAWMDTSWCDPLDRHLALGTDRDAADELAEDGCGWEILGGHRDFDDAADGGAALDVRLRTIGHALDIGIELDVDAVKSVSLRLDRRGDVVEVLVHDGHPRAASSPVRHRVVGEDRTPEVEDAEQEDQKDRQDERK